MIRLISGSTRIGANLYTPANGAFTAAPEMEKRLVEANVAVYVTGVATAQDGQEDKKTSDNTSETESSLNGVEDAVTSDGDIPEYNVDMTVNQLREIGKASGIKFKVGMTKEEMVAELDRIYGLDEDDEDALDLTAADPIE